MYKSISALFIQTYQILKNFHIFPKMSTLNYKNVPLIRKIGDCGGCTGFFNYGDY